MAYDETLPTITETEKEISAHDLLYAPQFSCTFNVIKNIYHPHVHQTDSYIAATYNFFII